jgi:hypothetical protein
MAGAALPDLALMMSTIFFLISLASRDWQENFNFSPDGMANMKLYGPKKSLKADLSTKTNR